jgi:hypothetical protein
MRGRTTSPTPPPRSTAQATPTRWDARTMRTETLAVSSTVSRRCGDNHGQPWPDAGMHAPSIRADTPDPSGSHAHTSWVVIKNIS